MIVAAFFCLYAIVCGTSLTDDKKEVCPNPKKENHSLLFLAEYKLRHKLSGLEVQIGCNTFIISNLLGHGLEGLVYLATDPNGNQAAIKALYKQQNTLASFKNELYATEKLGRLIAKDEDELIIVQKYIPGPSFGKDMERYSFEKAGLNENGLINDYPSNHMANHLKEKYMDILYNFRNVTQMAHYDFRPYNIIGDEAIDFSRSEILSSDPQVRESEIKYDDRHAEREWIKFYQDMDFLAIERNPFLPQALERAYDIWDDYLYITDANNLKQTKAYRNTWMTVLHYILITNDTVTKEFPSESDFF